MSPIAVGARSLIEAKVTRLTAHSSETSRRRTAGRRPRRREAQTRCRSSVTMLARWRRPRPTRSRRGLTAEIKRHRRRRDRLRRGASPIPIPRPRSTGCTPSTGRGRRRRRGTARPATGPAAHRQRARPTDGGQDVHRGDPRRHGRGDAARRVRRWSWARTSARRAASSCATDGLWGEFGDNRVIDTPLTESMIVGASIGAAINGLRPVAEIQFADFIHPAFNQIVSEAARMRYRSNNGFGVPMVVRAPYGGGVHGALYHSQSVEAFFTHVPGLKVVIPSTPYDAKGLLRTAIRDDDPVLFFEHKKMYRPVRGEVPDGDYAVPARLGRDPPDRAASHDDRLRADALLRPRGRRARGGGGDRRRGGRPPHPPAARPGHDPVVGAQDRQVPRRLRGQPLRRLRGGDLRDRRGGGVRLPRRAGQRGSPAPTSRACRTTTRSRTGSCSARRRSPTRSGSSPRTDGPGAGPRRHRGTAAAGARPVPRPARARHDLQPRRPCGVREPRPTTGSRS